MADAMPGVDIQRAQVEQKLSNLRQIYLDTDLEIAICKAQDPGPAPEQKQQQSRQLLELTRRRTNAAKGVDAMQLRLDQLPKEPDEEVDADALSEEPTTTEARVLN